MQQADPAPTILLDERSAASSLGLTPRTLQSWRWSGIGPSFVRVSARCIRYRISDLEQWAADRVKQNTGE